MAYVAASCNNHPVGGLIMLAERLRVHLDEAARAIGLTPQQAMFLARLEQPERMSALASQKECDPSSITSLVQRLERDGFVTRVADTTDGRARMIQITAKGRRTRQKFLDRLGDGTAIVGALSAEHRDGLSKLFATA